MSFGIIELLTRVGEDHVRVQNVQEVSIGVKERGRGRDRVTEITFVTDQITPSEFLLREPRMVGLVVWLPRERVERAQAEHEANYAAKGRADG